ncbi:MAG: phospho-N-acetylmuramoyl-pentapeptide-transferase, partial [Clostridia bacterium]|nr:phospho-N-acetylmuramoyl-pentapeptide-transferase [Clostridia bacterium]
MDYWVYGVVFAAAFGVAAGVGAFIVPMLRKLKLGQHILEIGPNWHKSKEGTPVMGGLIFIIASVLVTAVVLAFTKGKGAAPVLCVLFLALANGAIGFLDDCQKLLKKQNLGLKAKQKLVLQFVVGIAFLALVSWLGVYNGEVQIPFTAVAFTPKWFLVYPIALLMVVGTVNAANL